MGDTGEPVRKQAYGPSWEQGHWPLTQRDENTAAFDGDWGELEATLAKKIVASQPNSVLSQQDISRAVQESIKAIMMIRAYRIRGHLAAELDPLRLSRFEDQPELNPETYGFSQDMWDRRSSSTCPWNGIRVCPPDVGRSETDLLLHSGH